VADTPATAWYYGAVGSPYLGSKHAAAWNSQTPEGWPDVVDLVHHGIATSDWSVPFGTRVILEIVAVPPWAIEEYSHLIGRRAAGIVVDRTAKFVWDIYGEGYDLFPALAEALMGKDYLRIGTVSVKAYKAPPLKIVSQRRYNSWQGRAIR